MAAAVEATSKPSKQIAGGSPKGKVPHHPKGPAAVAPSPNIEAWLSALVSTSQQGSFFNPCAVHKEFRKSEATLFCVDCDAAGAGCCRAMCQHCVPAHTGHRTIQIRRYVYCDVVRAGDISPFVDIAGVQTYTINQAKVVFLNHRPQSKLLGPGAADACAICWRALREGCTYCSLACKVEALVREGRLGPSAMCGGCPPAGGCCTGDSTGEGLVPFSAASAAAAAALAAALAAGAPDAASDDGSDDCCASGGGGGGAAAALARRCSSGSGSDRATATQQRRASGYGNALSAAAAWAAKRSSDSSCQSFLDWHESNGHVCRRKQSSPRRSPLL